MDVVLDLICKVCGEPIRVPPPYSKFICPKCGNEINQGEKK